MIVTCETLITALLKVTDVLAHMHERHGLEGDPEHCMACLAFDESRVLDVLQAVARSWHLEPSR